MDKFMAERIKSPAVRDYMTRKIVRVDAGTSIARVSELMSRKKISCVVVEKARRPAGIITERDMINKVIAKSRDPRLTTADSIMTSPIFSISEETDLITVRRIMSSKKIRRAVVTSSGNRIAGIVTETDISKALSEVLFSKLDEIKLIYKKIRALFTDTVKALFLTLDAKDHYTGTHSKAVAALACEISDELGLDAPTKRNIYLAALFHDIGKIHIKDSILRKSASLLESEFEEIKPHSSISALILRPIGELKGTIDIIMHHHEWYNGKGYPMRLKRDEIPLGSRIITIADSYNALTTNRPYRAAMKPGQAIKMIKALSGKQFDPAIVKVFLKVIRRPRAYKDRSALIYPII
ncbi:MAG: CBS domain-containing protein [Candidatus Omnitrophica bacterium]|nr:CBS domain-containing protein [Candidatus Omnitrophota bacterium]